MWSEAVLCNSATLSRMVSIAPDLIISLAIQLMDTTCPHSSSYRSFDKHFHCKSNSCWKLTDSNYMKDNTIKCESILYYESNVSVGQLVLVDVTRRWCPTCVLDLTWSPGRGLAEEEGRSESMTRGGGEVHLPRDIGKRNAERARGPATLAIQCGLQVVFVCTPLIRDRRFSLASDHWAVSGEPVVGREGGWQPELDPKQCFFISNTGHALIYHHIQHTFNYIYMFI